MHSESTTTPSTARPSLEHDGEKSFSPTQSVDASAEVNEKLAAEVVPEDPFAHENSWIAWSTVVAG
jgi:hypothetical protein